MKALGMTLVALAASVVVGSAHAGPYILAGTDADDHGSATATANEEGWLFMQKALENLAASPSLTNTNKTVIALGSSSGTALTAATSAFNFSSLASSGWNFVSVPDLTSLPGGASFASVIGAGSILMLDSGGNVGGGLTNAEEAVLTANANAINSFVGAGGGLFSQAGDYGWLSTLVPGLSTNPASQTGLALTAAGNAQFPGLTNADLSAGPYHNSFLGVGSIPVLATGTGNASNLDVIIGSAGGSFTEPEPPPVVGAIPEPETYALMLAGLALVGAVARRRRPR
jgi:hypothetical protein